jgi:hypothetical protein
MYGVNNHIDHIFSIFKLHWLPGWWYPRGLIVHQKRYRTSDSSENVDIKISVFNIIPIFHQVIQETRGVH